LWCGVSVRRRGRSGFRVLDSGGGKGRRRHRGRTPLDRNGSAAIIDTVIVVAAPSRRRHVTSMGAWGEMDGGGGGPNEAWWKSWKWNFCLISADKTVVVCERDNIWEKCLWDVLLSQVR
jgi:hypothetical protein